MGCPQAVQGLSMVCSRAVDVLPVGYLWAFRGLSMGCPVGRLSVGCLYVLYIAVHVLQYDIHFPSAFARVSPVATDLISRFQERETQKVRRYVTTHVPPPPPPISAARALGAQSRASWLCSKGFDPVSQRR